VKAALHTRYGALEVRDVQRPALEPGRVLVRVHASSLNAVDWYGFTGRPYVARPMTGLRGPRSTELGHDFAGVVEEVGDGVADLTTGDRVFGSAAGALAEYVVPGEVVARMPAGTSFDEAATVPLAGFTALQGLRDRGGVERGQRVLVNGAAGGVGTFAVQIAKALGAEVHGVCSSRNVEQTRTLGAERVFDYTREDFTRSGERYDVLFDNAGNRSWRSMRRVVARGGAVVLCGGDRRKRMLGPLGHILRAKLAAKLGGPEARFFIANPNVQDLETLRKLVDTGGLRPVIEQRFALAQLEAAFVQIAAGHARSKIVVTVP
jgi:NADPH:quinone reductase-like Zn-dependent oxidoreductase